MRKACPRLLVLLGSLSLLHPAQALMTYGGSNTTNTTDPGNGLPWQNVVEIEDGSGGTTGSGIYLGNQFVLTANHVGPVSQIEIGGTTFFVDTSFNASYTGGSFSGGFTEIGNTDLKLVRLTQNPAATVTGLQTIHLNTSTTLDINTTTTNYIVGYGVGKGTAVTGGWNWDSTPGTERWGTNNIIGSQNNTANGSVATNTLLTQFDSLSGANDAAVTLDDSGGGLFFQSSGTWYLSGVTLYVTTSGTSFYTGDPNVTGINSGSVNFFGRVSSYATQITNATAVPEPQAYALMGCALGAVLVYKLGRKRSAGAQD